MAGRSREGHAGEGRDLRSDDLRRPRRRRIVATLLVLAALLFTGFMALGIWQVERRAWKLDLIERVDQRVHAAPVPAPGPDQWPLVTADRDEYRHVAVTGSYLDEQAAYTQAVTDLGPGHWVMTPFQTDRGMIVLVNRGFIPTGSRSAIETGAGQVPGVTTVTGLLRMTEPEGGFLRDNDPERDRWFSRDVAAIAQRRGLTDVAPYFIDADALQNPPPDAPVGGLTVVKFNNNHLVYMLTWFGLALMVLAAAVYLVRDEMRLRRGGN